MAATERLGKSPLCFAAATVDAVAAGAFRCLLRPPDGQQRVSEQCFSNSSTLHCAPWRAGRGPLPCGIKSTVEELPANRCSVNMAALIT